MAEWTYALASVAELKQVIPISSGDTGQDAVLETVLKRASEVIETHLGREIVSRGALTEYHSVYGARVELHLLDWPLISITSVKEGGWVGATWTADATLTTTAGDYVAHSSASGVKLMRTSSGALWYWPVGFESVQVVYTAGYANTAAVPGALKEVCLSLAGRKYAHIRRGLDASSQTITDAMGSVSRLLPDALLRLEQEALFTWKNNAQSTTGRR